jgi:hypothetical protein
LKATKRAVASVPASPPERKRINKKKEKDVNTRQFFS